MGGKKTKQEETLRDRKQLDKLLFILTKQNKTEQRKAHKKQSLLSYCVPV